MDIIKKLAKDYSYGSSETSDEKYDDLFDIVKNESEFEISEIGDMEKTTKDKVKLPVQMMSMDKFSSQRDFENWLKSHSSSTYNISSKLDGISLLLFEDRIYTRGNGTYGKNVSWIRECLNIPLPPKDMSIRGELILTKDGWNIIKSENPKVTNPLSFIAGWANSDTHKLDYIDHIKFIAFSLGNAVITYDSSSEQFRKLEEFGFNVPYNKNFTKIFYRELQSILDDFRSNNPFVLDGIIVAEDSPHVRDDTKNPPYARAYKDFVSDSSVVIEVEWNISRYGLLKPKVIFEPIVIGGKTYTKASGHNAAFIKDNMIAAGATISIGINISPIVKSIIEYATQEDVDEMFEFLENNGAIWHGKELLDNTQETMTRKIKGITKFMDTIQVGGFKEGSVTKVMNGGFPTIYDILNITQEEMCKILGKNGISIHSQMKAKYNSASDVDIFIASGIFQGIGRKIATELFTNITLSDFIQGKIPSEIPNIGQERIKILEENRPEFITWFVKLPIRETTGRNETDKSEDGKNISKETQFKVILTGDPPKNKYKNKKEFLLKHPELSDVGTSFKNVTFVIYNKYTATETEKFKKATLLDIKTVTYEDYDSTVESFLKQN